jgi:hypothetical protein
MGREGIGKEEIKKRSTTVNLALPDGLVLNYLSLISGLTLPDVKDRHVLAAAIKTKANVIVTNNLKDFAEDYLATFGLVAKSAHDFNAVIIDLTHEKALEAFRKLVLNRRNPDLDEYEVLDNLIKNGLINSATYLHSLIWDEAALYFDRRSYNRK